MTRTLSALLIATVSMLALVAGGAQRAQAQKGGEAQTVSISFRNDTTATVLVQGASIVKGVRRPGQPISIQAGKSSFDNNVPAGKRLITIVDNNQNSRVLLQDTIQVPAGRDLQLVIRPMPGNPNRVILAVDQ